MDSQENKTNCVLHSGHDSAVVCQEAGGNAEALTIAYSDMDTSRELLLQQ